jgi:hypothetical protein
MNVRVGLKLKFELKKFGISGLLMIRYKRWACLGDICFWDETWQIQRR